LRNSFYCYKQISQKNGIFQIRDTIKEGVCPEKLRRMCEKAGLGAANVAIIAVCRNGSIFLITHPPESLEKAGIVYTTLYTDRDIKSPFSCS
jgi:hypothetical protein